MFDIMIRALNIGCNIINEKGNCLEVLDDISEKNTIFHIFSYNSPASVEFILGIAVFADNKHLDLRYKCYK